MSQDDSLISKLLKQQQNNEENGSIGSLNEFAMDIEFPHTSEKETEKP